MISALQHGLAGMQRFSGQLDATSGRIARSAMAGTAPPLSESSSAAASMNAGNITNDMVDMLAEKRGFEASAKMVKAADEMMGTLLDTFA